IRTDCSWPNTRNSKWWVRRISASSSGASCSRGGRVIRNPARAPGERNVEASQRGLAESWWHRPSTSCLGGAWTGRPAPGRTARKGHKNKWRRQSRWNRQPMVCEIRRTEHGEPALGGVVEAPLAASRTKRRELAASLRKETGLIYFWVESAARMR